MLGLRKEQGLELSTTTQKRLPFITGDLYKSWLSVLQPDFFKDKVLVDSVACQHGQFLAQLL